MTVCVSDKYLSSNDLVARANSNQAAKPTLLLIETYHNQLFQSAVATLDVDGCYVENCGRRTPGIARARIRKSRALNG
jgi:hypothetical protein